MEKIDLRKQLKYLYAPSAKNVAIVDVPEFKFVMLDGTLAIGETPEMSPEYQDAIGALYGASFTLKFMSKLRVHNPIDYTVMALEGLWWTDSGEFAFQQDEPWRWTMMMVQPDHITEEMYHESLQKLREKRDNPSMSVFKEITHLETKFFK